MNGVVVSVATFIVAGILEDGHRAYVTKAAFKAELAKDIRCIFRAGSLVEAKRILDETVAKYSECQAKLAA